MKKKTVSVGRLQSIQQQLDNNSQECCCTPGTQALIFEELEVPLVLNFTFHTVDVYRTRKMPPKRSAPVCIEK